MNIKVFSAACFTLCLIFSTAGMAGEKKKAAPEKKKVAAKSYQGEVRLGTRIIDVDDDEGRFREDLYQTDDWSGGLERFWFDGTSGKVRLEMEMKALYDDDYSGMIKLSREDLGYIKIDYDRDRRFFDGSNEAWDTSLYGLTRDLGEKDDDDMYIDRTDFNLELGFTPSSGLEVIGGWHHWERRGEEVLLRGSRAAVTTNATLPQQRSIPAYSEVNGESDSFYFDISYPVKEKYNLRYRQEYETYRDNQHIIFPRYKDGGLEQFRTFEDEPRFQQWTSMLMFDTQFEKNMYFTANFMHDSLENRTDRDVVRPGDANPRNFVKTKVDNERSANVYTSGFMHTNLFEVKGLELTLGVRLEDADTNSDSEGYQSGTTSRKASTDLEETRLEERIQLVYRGLAKTVLTAELEFEQRDLDYTEVADMRATESFDGVSASHFNSGTPINRYAVDIEHRNEKYTLKGVHRFNRNVKLTGQYRYKNQDRDYDVVADNDLIFYPGGLGDYKRDGHDFLTALDWRIYKTWSLNAKYQYTDEEIWNQNAGTDSQDFENHRYALNVTGMPVTNLLVAGSFMYDDYSMDTPTDVPAGSDWADGSAAYDFDGDAYTILLSASYAFNSQVSTDLDWQNTSGTGTIDYDYNKIGVGFTIKPFENQTLKIGYAYYDFDDDTGNGFDNYDVHAGLLSYSFKF